jgi:hypothetical protein
MAAIPVAAREPTLVATSAMEAGRLLRTVFMFSTGGALPAPLRATSMAS